MLAIVFSKNEKIIVGKGKTVRKFGSFIDVYDIRQSVEDGATIQILYENRLPELTIEDSTIDQLFNRVFAKKSEEEREAIKDKYVTKANLLGAEERIKKVCLDILLKRFIIEEFGCGQELLLLFLLELQK